ncbi:MAG TPA: TonB-dependent receptor, partial [Candidatus Sulfopaludibacter sp.]|nr:TonB-dependent receptor [Candidatus Sulfopaludibacter sp.]
MQRLLVFGLILAAVPAYPQASGTIRGSIVDARGGEALASVQVQLTGGAYRTVSDSKGSFQIASIAPGDYVLNVSTVGYHLANHPFHLAAGETKEFEVVLTPDALRQTDTVEARTDPFETSRADSPSTLVMAGNDVKNLGSVLADDPLRAVQSLPGVTSNNDFDARFSLRGADYNRIGLYLDNVLLHQPFHMLQGQNVSGSGTAFNGDMVDSMELHEGAYPVRFEDRSAGALDVTTREGSRTATTFRVAASASNAGIMAEGPIGKKKRGSWLVATRKSYLQYILARTFPNNTFIFGLEDVQGRFTYDLSDRSKVTLYLLESFSDIDRSASRSTLGINSLMTGGYHYTLANLGWRYTPADSLLVNTHVAWMREKWDNENPANLSLGAGFYGEWVGNTNATWIWNSRAPLDFGVSMRRLRDEGYGTQYQSATSTRTLDRARGTATRASGYAQQSFLAWKGRVHLTAGARWDHENVNGIPSVSPQASVSLMLTSSTRLQLGWGQYVQYPELAVLTSILGNRYLPPNRSNQTIAAVEQRVGLRTRLRAEWYNRADRDLIFQPLAIPRMLSPGKYFTP